MALWTDLGLPLAQRSGYGYSIDSGVLRSPVEAAQPRQLRKWRTNKKTFAASYLLTQAQLQLAEGFLETVGYSWFVMPLLSGRDEFEPVIDHCVRLAQDYRVESAGEDTYKLTLVLEQLVETSIYGTTVMYPVEALDAVQQAAPDTPMGQLYPTKWDESVQQAAPDTLGGTLVQTVFVQTYAHPWEDAVQQSAPDTPYGLLGPTYFPHLYDHGDEAVQQSVPDTPYGILGPTYFPLDYDHGFESLQQSAPDTPTGTLA